MNRDGVGKTAENGHATKENVPVWNTESQVTLDSVWSSGICIHMGFPGASAVKNLPANAGDTGSIPGLGRSLGGGNGNLLQYTCLENPMDRGAQQSRVHEVTKESVMT